jgi:hypothetical protein
MKFKSGKILVLLAVVSLASPVLAQDGAGKTDPDKGKKKDESAKSTKVVRNTKKILLVKTEFLEAYQSKKWDSVEVIFDGVMTTSFPELKKDYRNVFKYCEALFNLGQKKAGKKLEKAVGVLEKLIDANPRYIEAIFLLSKCLARQKKDGAKDQLLTAAKLGLPVLREINDKKNAKIFGHLLNEPRFILDIMNAPRNATENFDEVRNPFLSPFEPDEKGEIRLNPNKTGPSKAPNASKDANRIKLEKIVDQLFEDIEDLIERQEYNSLLGKFKDLNGHINAYKKIGDKVVQKKLDKWKKLKRDRQFEEVQVALQLQLYVTRGNKILRGMATGLQKEEFEKVFQGFQTMSNLVDKMRSEERDAFTRNADALFYKAKELNDKGNKKKRIQELQLQVTGIVLDPGTQGGERQSGNRAIINDRIYAEGQALTDESDDPIPDLTIFAIFEGSVRFKYQDTTFDRPLNPVDANNPLARKAAPERRGPSDKKKDGK